MYKFIIKVNQQEKYILKLNGFQIKRMKRNQCNNNSNNSPKLSLYLALEAINNHPHLDTADTHHNNHQPILLNSHQHIPLNNQAMEDTHLNNLPTHLNNKAIHLNNLDIHLNNQDIHLNSLDTNNHHHQALTLHLYYFIF